MCIYTHLKLFIKMLLPNNLTKKFMYIVRPLMKLFFTKTTNYYGIKANRPRIKRIQTGDSA